MDEQANALIVDLMSMENETRQRAEQRFEQIPPQQKFVLLLTCYTMANNTEHQRLLSMILLRRMITTEFDNFYPELPPDHQLQLQQHLITSINTETSLQVRNRICECIAELAKNVTDEHSNVAWPGLREQLMNWARSPSDSLRQAVLHVFADFPSVFGVDDSTILHVKGMLQATLQSTDIMRVRVEAARGLSAFLRSAVVDTPEKQAAFVDMIPLLVRLLVDQAAADFEDDTVLEVLTEIAEHCPKIMRNHLASLLDTCIAYIQNENTLESRRNLCIELIVTLCENAPSIMRKFGSRHLIALLPQIFKMMSDLEEDSGWDTNDSADNDDMENDCPAMVGETSLDRIAIAIGGKALLNPAMAALAPMLNSPNWKERHAALMAISSMGEGCKKQMTPMLEQVVGGILNFLGDSHPRVRYAAINCLGQMANDFSPTFEKNFHGSVLPKLCEVLVDFNNPRVQAHAGAALVNFFEECPNKITVKYIPTIAPALARTLEMKMNELQTQGKKLVLEQVLVTISAFAESCQKDFIPHYDQFVPSLQYIIKHANSKELELLRGKAIECITLIGVAVGKERFAQDAACVMDILLEGQVANELSEDSQLLSYMIYGWMRLCTILGRDFERYLPFVMPSVMKTAALTPQMTLVNDDDDALKDGDHDDWTYISYEDGRAVGIRTAGLEEKATAFEMLLCYAKELKESFGPYVSEALKVAVPALKFYVHEGVRISAASCVSELLSCAKANNLNVLEMWNYAAPQILEAITEEEENEVIPEIFDCLAHSVEAVGSAGLNAELVNIMMDHVIKQLDKHFKRDEERHNVRRDEDYDEDVEERLREEGDEDGYTLTKVEELIRQLCSALGTNMIPYLDKVVPHFGKLIMDDRPISDIQWALCFYDDITECVGEQAALRYKDVFIEKLVQYIGHASPEIRQAAAYGVGIIAKFGGDQLIPYISTAVPLLCEVIARPDSRTEENVVATENAISAVAKVIMNRPAAVANIDGLIGVYIQWLPIYEDEEEIGPCFELVCALMESNHPALLGQNNANLPHIIKCMAVVFGKRSLEKDSEVGKRCIALLKTLQQNQALFSSCIAQLSQEETEGLNWAMTE